jgi:hypothetical protein
MRQRNWSRRSASRRQALVLWLWLGRIGLVWLLAYPIYCLLGDSPLLQSSRTDRELLRAGGETLLALLEARASSLSDLSGAMWLLAAVAATLALVGSSFTWVAIHAPDPLFGARIRSRVCAVLPTFALITVGQMLPMALLAWCFWQLVPVIGELLEPRLGERGTDLVQLFLVLCLLGAIAVYFTLSDVLRAVVVAGDVPTRHALPTARRLYGLCPLRITLHAGTRFVLALSLQLASAWLAARAQWLAGSSWLLLVAIAACETSALLTLWLRLDWIAWISNTHRLMPRTRT